MVFHACRINDKPPASKKLSTAERAAVPTDLLDEDYQRTRYAEMLTMYEGTLAAIVEGEIVKSKVLRITEQAVILDVGFKSEGSVPLDEFKDIRRKAMRSKSSSSTWRTRTARVLSEEESRLHAGVGEDPHGLRERRAGRGRAGQEDQGRRGRSR
jgi:hypothetical protein